MEVDLMTTWVLGKEGVAPIKNPKSRKRRNPAPSNTDLGKWAKNMRHRRWGRGRRNPTPLSNFDNILGGGVAVEEPSLDFGWLGGLGRGAKAMKKKSRKKKPKKITKTQLLNKAKKLGIPCRTQMTKRQLQYHIRKAEKLGGPYMPGRKAKWGKCRPVRKRAARSKAKSKKGRKKAARKRKNPSWWSRLLPGNSGGLEDKVFKNPRGSLDMAKRRSFLRGKSYRFGSKNKRGPKRKLSIRFLNNPKKRRKRRKRKNPIELNRPVLGGISLKDAGIIGGSLAALNLAENALQRWGIVDLSGYGRYATAVIKLGIGLGGAMLAERANIFMRGSSTDRMFKIAAVAAALGDLARGFSEQVVSPAMDALGLGYAVGPGDFLLGETVANPADTGSVVLSNGLGYAVGPQDYMLGETVANPASQGAVVTTGLGELSYNPHGLGGGFYAGNVSLPKQSGEHPDFMNQVPGRPDLSAVPDFMR